MSKCVPERYVSTSEINRRRFLCHRTEDFWCLVTILCCENNNEFALTVEGRIKGECLRGDIFGSLVVGRSFADLVVVGNKVVIRKVGGN